MGLLLLSGAKGLGKSSALAALARILGQKARGVICPGEYADGRKSAVYWLDLARVRGEAAAEGAGSRASVWLEASGEPASVNDAGGRPSACPLAGAAPLAREQPGFAGLAGQPILDLSDAGLVRYGKWEFSRAALSGADEACLRALAEPFSGLVIVDEIGPLELSHRQGYIKTLERLDGLFGSGAPRRSAAEPPAVIVATRQDLAAQLCARWPESALFELSYENRERAAASLAALISSWL